MVCNHSSNPAHGGEDGGSNHRLCPPGDAIHVTSTLLLLPETCCLLVCNGNRWDLKTKIPQMTILLEEGLVKDLAKCGVLHVM